MKENVKQEEEEKEELEKLHVVVSIKENVVKEEENELGNNDEEKMLYSLNR